MTRITVEIPEESKAELVSYLEAKGFYFEENEDEDVNDLFTTEQIEHFDKISAGIKSGDIKLIDWEIVRKKYIND